MTTLKMLTEYNNATINIDNINARALKTLLHYPYSAGK